MREMKDSGIEWIKEIPAEWAVQRGKAILKLQKRSPEGYEEVITCFRDGEVTLRKNRREEGFTFSDKEIGYQGIQTGDLVIHGMDGFAGAIGISDSDGKGSPVLVVCTSDQNQRYLMYYLRMLATQNVFVALATGIRERSCDLRWNKIAELLFPIPPMEVQDRISAFLDLKCEKVDALISKQQEAIEKLTACKLSVITEAVTKGLNSDTQVKDSGIKYVQSIPTSWENRKMISILAMRVVDGAHESPELFDEGIPYISATAIENGNINFDKMRGYISSEYCDICDQRYVPALNDILVIKLGASTGQVAMVETTERFNIWVPLAAVRCNEKANPRFVYYAFQSDYFVKQMEQSWTYGTQQTLGVKTIERLRILLPPINEQVQIAEYLDRKYVAINSAIEKRQALIDRLEEYKKSLIYEVVTGKREV